MDDHEKTCMKLLPQVAALLCTLWAMHKGPP
jgi:hypothetical protein